MRARTATERQRLLDELLEVEQRVTVMLNGGTGARTAAVPRTTDVRVAAVQRTLAPTEVLVEFVLLEPRSYCLAITTHGVQLVPLSGKMRLESLSKRAREELQAGRGPERTGESGAL